MRSYKRKLSRAWRLCRKVGLNLVRSLLVIDFLWEIPIKMWRKSFLKVCEFVQGLSEKECNTLLLHECKLA